MKESIRTLHISNINSIFGQGQKQKGPMFISPFCSLVFAFQRLRSYSVIRHTPIFSTKYCQIIFKCKTFKSKLQVCKR